MGLWLCQYGFFNQLSTLMETRMHVEEDGHLCVLPLPSCFFLSIELLFQVMRYHIKSDKMSSGCSCQRSAEICILLLAGRNGHRMLSIFIIDFFIEFSVSRSTPPSCRCLCPWHIVRVALSLPSPLSLLCTCTLRKLSCKIILRVQAGL